MAMAKTSIALGGGREDSFDWLNRNVAQLLGTGVTGTPLRRDRALRDITGQEKTAFSQRLRDRFRRVQDGRTSRVRFEIAGGGAIMLGAAGRGDPELERIGRTFIPPARAALEEISTIRPRAEVTAEAASDAMAGARDGLDRLEAQLREPPLPVYLVFVIADAVLLLDNLEDVLLSLNHPPNEIEEAEDVLRIAAARSMLVVLAREAANRLQATEGPGPLGIAEFLREVQQVAPLVADAAGDLARLLADLEIRDIQLKRLQVGTRVGPQDLASILHQGVEEPGRWLVLARTGSAQHRRVIEVGAERLHAAATAIGAPAGLGVPSALERIIVELGLQSEECCDDGRQVMEAMRRFARMSEAVLRRVRPASPLVFRTLSQRL